MPVEGVMEPNRNNMENYGNLQLTVPKYETHIMGAGEIFLLASSLYDSVLSISFECG